MINVAYVIDSIDSPYAGTENQLLQTIKRIDRSRVQPHLICLRKSDWWASQAFDFPSASMNFRSLKGLDYFRGRRRFREFCRSHDIHIVQTFFHDANLVGTLWARAAGIPIVIASRRNLGSGYWHNRREIAILRWLRGKTDHYITNSAAAANEAIQVERLDPQRVTVIPNGINPDDYSRPDDATIAATRQRWGFGQEHIVVGAVANLRPIKNLPFFIRCASKIAPRFPQARFVIIGEGNQRDELQRLAESLGLGDRLLLAGRSSTVASDLYGFDIAVLCSKGESLSNSLMEYMATGRPVVASDVGGNAELITSAELGHIYSPDDERDFVDAVGRYLESKALRDEAGLAGRESIRQRCCWETTLGRLIELYEGLLTQKPRSRSRAQPNEF